MRQWPSPSAVAQSKHFLEKAAVMAEAAPAPEAMPTLGGRM